MNKIHRGISGILHRLFHTFLCPKWGDFYNGFGNKNAGTNDLSRRVYSYPERFDHLLRHYEWLMLFVSPAPYGAAWWPSALGSVLAGLPSLLWFPGYFLSGIIHKESSSTLLTLYTANPGRAFKSIEQGPIATRTFGLPLNLQLLLHSAPP